MIRVRSPATLAALLVVPAVVAPTTPVHAEPDEKALTTPAPEPVRLPRGVAVVASKDASVDDTWRLASSVYRNAELRPRGMSDATARALAGEAPALGAPARVQALFDLRASLPAQGPTTRRLLASIASELGVSGVVLVHRSKAGAPRARLFVASTGDFSPPVLWPQPDAAGQLSWKTSVAWLASLAHDAPRQPQEGGSVFASPWFWGALTAAAGAILIGYAASRDDEPQTIHLQGRVGP